MSLTMQILRILAKSRDPMKAEAFAAITGEPLDKVVRSLRGCVIHRYMLYRNGCYECTLTGAVRAKWEPKTDPRRLALKAARLAKKRAAEREDLARKQADGIVAQAMAKPHALHGIWGPA